MPVSPLRPRPKPLTELIARLEEIRSDLQAAVAAHGPQIEAVAPQHRTGAINLVRYTALRHHDLRGLQNQLMDLGATSLATVEADVQAKLEAAHHVLAALSGDAGPWDSAVIDESLREGDEILAAHAQDLFGPPRPGRPTRIMVTLPSEAADDPTLVAAYVAAGMDVARINCAHDGPVAWRRMIEEIRTSSTAAGRPVSVSMDLPGPKLRTGPITPGPAVAKARVTRNATGAMTAPARLWLVPADGEPVVATAPRTVSGPPALTGRPALVIRVDPAWLAHVRRGDLLGLHDTRGKHRTFAIAAVTTDGVLAEGKRSAYVGVGTLLTCAGHTTPAQGIAPTASRLSLVPGDRLVLTSDMTPVNLPAAGEIARIGCTLSDAVAALRVGQPVSFDDGAIDAAVESLAPGQATLVIVRTKPGGQRLGAEKGINLPETELPLSALTFQDESYLPFVAANADVVAVSFVRSVADIDHVLKVLEQQGANDLGLVLKIETTQAFRALPSILLSAMRHRRLGVMIARGDLAIEVGFERLSEVPRQILALCEAAHVPTIWATQVLDTLAQTGQPSRAEITDAAAAQRSECVMLNKGPHIPQAIAALDDILARMNEVQHKSRTLMRHIHSWDDQ